MSPEPRRALLDAAPELLPPKKIMWTIHGFSIVLAGDGVKLVTNSAELEQSKVLDLVEVILNALHYSEEDTVPVPAAAAKRADQ